VRAYACTSRRPPAPPMRQRRPRVPRVRSCAAPKPHGCPTPVRGTYRSSPEHHRPLSWLTHIRLRRVTCASPHPVPHLSRGPEKLATSWAATLALPHVHACPHRASPRASHRSAAWHLCSHLNVARCPTLELHATHDARTPELSAPHLRHCRALRRVPSRV
jgi:hypothetical protein